MICPKCNGELKYLHRDYRGRFIKDIYKCPNCLDIIKKRIKKKVMYK